MKRSLLTVGMVAATLLVASSALAAGVNLRWTNCGADGGTDNRTFACNSNLGSNVLVGSFVLDNQLVDVNGNELVVDLITQAAPTLPDWWQFKTVGTCRQNALSIAAHDGASCPDMFQGQASMNIAAYQTRLTKPDLPAEGGARILCVNAVAAAAIVTLEAGQEYGIARWTVSNIKTVGTGICDGCTTPVCIVFNSANLTTQGNLNNTLLGGPASPGSQIVTFQGVGADCQAVPTKNATWGRVKSMYR